MEKTDGTSNTVMVVETSRMGIHWAAPTDLSLNELDGVASNHSGLVNVVFGDGHVEAVEGVEPSMVTATAGD